jgi:hypothetical protein
MNMQARSAKSIANGHADLFAPIRRSTFTASIRSVSERKTDISAIHFGTLFIECPSIEQLIRLATPRSHLVGSRASSTTDE